MTTETLDPIAQLERMSRRQGAEDTVAKAIARARVQLVLGKDAKAAFFATLALRLKPEVDWNLDTAATDGRRLSYSPEFVNSLSPEQRVGLLAHEVMHNAMAHAARQGARDHALYNIAADLAVNPILREAGFTLPPGALYPGQGTYSDLPEGLSAEEYYAKLQSTQQEEQQGNDGQPGQPGDDPGGCGAVVPAPDQAEQQEIQAEWQVATAQAAAAAQGKGKLPGALDRLVKEIVEPTVPWQDVLREFVTRSVMARDDYSWAVPNRRFIAQGLYMPSLRSEGMGEIVVAIDTSGSIDDAMLKRFSGELNGVLDCKPCRVVVLYCDDAIQGEPVYWEPADGQLTLESRGGGGTSHLPIWAWLKQHGEEPACVVCLTDGYTSFGSDPGVPVLWAMTTERKPPFGQVIQVK